MANESNSANVSKFISKLLHSRTQVHVFHLQTNTYASHMAMGDFYESIGGLLDELVECYQGEFTDIKGYINFPIVDFTDIVGCIKYFMELLNYIKANRKEFVGTDYQNIIDEITALIKKTIYKLKKLK